jgi:hypothetical protein
MLHTPLDIRYRIVSIVTYDETTRYDETAGTARADADTDTATAAATAELMR